MIEFDDFDAWGAAVNGASLRLVCDAIDTGVWTLGIADLGGVVLQVASEGGGNICYGANTHAGTILFIPLSQAANHVVNGEPLDDDSLFLIPRGADFRISVRRHAHQWCSIGLPFDAALPPGVGGNSARVGCPPGALPRLRRLVREIGDGLLAGPADTPAHAVAGRALGAAALDCLRAVQPGRPRLGRPRLDRGEIIRRVMQRIDSSLVTPTAEDLTNHVSVTSRTLLRAFQESFGVAPKRYLIFRELHAVRRSLLAGGPGDATVADVLTRHGIWEFGRFASRYRRHFGEPPSETLRRART